MTKFKANLIAHHVLESSRAATATNPTVTDVEYDEKQPNIRTKPKHSDRFQYHRNPWVWHPIGTNLESGNSAGDALKRLGGHWPDPHILVQL
jgi:hypothetical protein